MKTGAGSAWADVYASKAGETAEAVASAVETAGLAVDAAREGKAHGRYLTQVLVEAEEDAGSAQGTFDGIQPPAGASWPGGWLRCPGGRCSTWSASVSGPCSGRP